MRVYSGFTSVLYRPVPFMRGSETFLVFGHSLQEFLFSGQWAPSDTASGGGQVGAAMFISGSLVICLLALLFALPVSLAAAIYMTEIASPSSRRHVQPFIELLRGFPLSSMAGLVLPC